MSDRDNRIRDEAYRIWVEAGRPDGAEKEHWTEAERRLGAEERDNTVVAGPKSKKTAAKAACDGPPGESVPKPSDKAAAGAAAAPPGGAKPRTASQDKSERVQVAAAAKPPKKPRKSGG